MPKIAKKKMAKTTTKSIDFDLGVKEALAIWRPKSSKFAYFGIFEWQTLNRKISVTKV